MNYPIIRLSSVTYAIRAQKELDRHGIRAYIKKHTSGLQTYGCGYGVEIHGDVNTAAQIIRNSGIRIVAIDQA